MFTRRPAAVFDPQNLSRLIGGLTSRAEIDAPVSDDHSDGTPKSRTISTTLGSLIQLAGSKWWSLYLYIAMICGEVRERPNRAHC